MQDRRIRPFIRHIVLFGGLVAVLACALVGPAAAQSDTDREAVRQAVLDYVEAFYEADPARIERSVHPDLAKGGYMVPPGGGEPRMLPMSYEQAVQFAGMYNKNGDRIPEGAPKEIEILDMMELVANVKLKAHWGTDYLLLSKDDGVWKIRMVLWQAPLGE